jgi:hypothetical protein
MFLYYLLKILEDLKRISVVVISKVFWYVWILNIKGYKLKRFKKSVEKENKNVTQWNKDHRHKI